MLKRPRLPAAALVTVLAYNQAVAMPLLPLVSLISWQQPGQAVPPTYLAELGAPLSYPGAAVQQTDPDAPYYVDPSLPLSDQDRLKAYIVAVRPEMSTNFILLEHGQRVIASRPELYDTIEEVTLNADGSYVEADGTVQGFPIRDDGSGDVYPTPDEPEIPPSPDYDAAERSGALMASTIVAPFQASGDFHPQIHTGSGPYRRMYTRSSLSLGYIEGRCSLSPAVPSYSTWQNLVDTPHIYLGGWTNTPRESIDAGLIFNKRPWNWGIAIRYPSWVSPGPGQPFRTVYRQWISGSDGATTAGSAATRFHSYADQSFAFVGGTNGSPGGIAFGVTGPRVGYPYGTVNTFQPMHPHFDLRFAALKRMVSMAQEIGNEGNRTGTFFRNTHWSNTRVAGPIGYSVPISANHVGGYQNHPQQLTPQSVPTPRPWTKYPVIGVSWLNPGNETVNIEMRNGIAP